MPYAAKDRIEFIKRSNLNPDSRILDLGGMLSEELSNAVLGITSKRHLSNAVVLRPMLLPFRNSLFSAVVSYHYFDLVSSEKLGFVFEETARVLHKNASLSFMILHWSAKNEAQKSNLLFNDILRYSGALFEHDFQDISMMLNTSGFTKITIESIKREIAIPQEFINEHFLMLGKLVKIEKTHGKTFITYRAKRYFSQVKEYGEAMLPAVHFIAKK